jgi:hypothetical protein
MKNIAFTIPMLLAASGWGAEQTNAPVRRDFPSFSLIAERNIFNMNRSGRRPYTPPSERESQRPARTESFALVGTMSYEKGLFAFFEGSSSQFTKVLSPSNSIAGFTIAEVTPTSVKLSSTNGNLVELPVGMQLKRQDEGEWSLSERTDVSRSYASSSYSGSRSSRSYSSSSSSSTSSSSGPDDPEALRRLMQRRSEEGASAEPATTETAPATETGAVSQEPRLENAEKAEKPADSGANGAADDILKKLMEKREQEINK